MDLNKLKHQAELGIHGEFVSGGIIQLFSELEDAEMFRDVYQNVAYSLVSQAFLACDRGAITIEGLAAVLQVPVAQAREWWEVFNFNGNIPSLSDLPSWFRPNNSISPNIT